MNSLKTFWFLMMLFVFEMVNGSWINIFNYYLRKYSQKNAFRNLSSISNSRDLSDNPLARSTVGW